MPNPRDTMETNAKRLAEAIKNNSDADSIFDRRLSPDICAVYAVFARPMIVGEMQEAPSVTMETRFSGESIFNVVKISPPSFLNKEQSEFFMSKFPLKGKNGKF